MLSDTVPKEGRVLTIWCLRVMRFPEIYASLRRLMQMCPMSIPVFTTRNTMGGWIAWPRELENWKCKILTDEREILPEQFSLLHRETPPRAQLSERVQSSHMVTDTQYYYQVTTNFYAFQLQSLLVIPVLLVGNPVRVQFQFVSNISLICDFTELCYSPMFLYSIS